MAASRGIKTSRPGAPLTKRRSAHELRTLLLAAAREEFKAKGFDGATTAAIAKRAQIAEIQLYRLFPSKHDLFGEAIFAPIRDHFRAFNAKHGAHARDGDVIREKANLYVLELMGFLNEHARVLAALLGPSKSSDAPHGANPFGGGLQTFLNESAALMSARATAPGEIDTNTIGRIAFAALLGCITYKHWLFTPADAESGAIDHAIAQFILAGVAPYSDVTLR